VWNSLGCSLRCPEEFDRWSHFEKNAACLGVIVRQKSERRDNSRLLRVVAAVVLIATLYFARVVFIPLALALLVSLLLTPLVVILEKIKLPRVVAISLVVLAVASAIGAMG